MAIKNIFTSITDQIVSQRQQRRMADLYRNLMRREARIGGTVFGPVPAGRRREFFCLDKHTWVWHEEWTDSNGQRKIVTTRYNVRPDSILKSQNGNNYQAVGADEARRLHRAAHMYQQKISQEIYDFA